MAGSGGDDITQLQTCRACLLRCRYRRQVLSGQFQGSASCSRAQRVCAGHQLCTSKGCMQHRMAGRDALTDCFSLTDCCCHDQQGAGFVCGCVGSRGRQPWGTARVSLRHKAFHRQRWKEVRVWFEFRWASDRWSVTSSRVLMGKPGCRRRETHSNRLEMHQDVLVATRCVRCRLKAHA